MQFSFGNMTLELNVFHLCKKLVNYEEFKPKEVCLNDTLVQEHVDQLM